MIEFEIRGEQYNGKQDWRDITLREYISLCKVEIPEKLRNLWTTSSDDKAYEKASEAVTSEDAIKIFPEYYGEIIRRLTNIPDDVIDLMDSGLRDAFFHRAFSHFILSMFTSHPLNNVEGKNIIYEPPDIKSFKIGKDRYYLPKTLKIYGEEIPLGEEPVISFAEAADIEIAIRHLAEGAVDRLPMFVSVYCRKLNEKYDEKKAMQREKLFLDLNMEVVWAVFFCIRRLLERYLTSTQSFLKGAARLYRDISVKADSEISDG